VIERGAEQRPGVLASLRGLTGGALAIVQTRPQRLASELEERGIHEAQMLASSACASFCAAGGAVLVTAWIVIAPWGQYRLLAIAVLALIYFAGFAAALRVLMINAAQRPKLLAAAPTELQQDCDLLRS